MLGKLRPAVVICTAHEAIMHMKFSMLSQASKSVGILLLYSYLISLSGENALRNEMTITSECVCSGFGITYECSVMGTENGFTVWRGSAFDCVGEAITLRHRLFTSGRALGECNGGSILGSSLRMGAGSFYISQLSVRNSTEVIGETIECVLFDANVTAKVIGYIEVNTTTDPFPPPDEVNINLSDLGLRRITFSWNPVAPDCPAIHYNILASNCGSCPTTTNHTTVTCTDIPIKQDAFCAFALQSVVCGNIVGILSNPISVSLSDNTVVREGIINGNVNDNERNVPPINFLNAFIGALISAIALAVILTLSVIGFMIAMIALKRNIRKKNSRTQLARTQLAKKYKTTVRYSRNVDLKPAPVDDQLDTTENTVYEPEPISNLATVDAEEENMEYEPVAVPLDTNTNISYALHTR